VNCALLKNFAPYTYIGEHIMSTLMQTRKYISYYIRLQSQLQLQIQITKVQLPLQLQASRI